MGQRFSTSCVMVAGIVALGALAPQSAQSRRLIPDRPSVEVRLEALRALRQSTRLSSTGRALEASPFKTSPSVPPTNGQMRPMRAQPSAPQAAPRVMQENVSPPAAPVIQTPAPAPKAEKAAASDAPVFTKKEVKNVAPPALTPRQEEPLEVVASDDIPEAVPTLDMTLDEMTAPASNDMSLPKDMPETLTLPPSEQEMSELPEPDLSGLDLTPPAAPEPVETESTGMQELPELDAEPVDAPEQPMDDMPELELPELDAPPAAEVEDVSIPEEAAAVPPADTPLSLDDDPDALTKEMDALLEDAETPDLPEFDEPSMELPELDTLPEAAAPDEMPDDMPMDDPMPEMELPEDDAPALDAEPVEATPPALPEPGADMTPPATPQPVAPPPAPPAKEKEEGFLPNLKSAFTSFLGGDEEEAAPPPAPSPSITPAPPAPAPATATPPTAPELPDISNASPPVDAPQDGLPDLPEFTESSAREMPNELPDLPEFDDGSASDMPVEEGLPLPPLPFGEQSAPPADAATATPPVEQETAALSPLPDASLDSIDNMLSGQTSDNVALAVFFSQSETEVPLAFQQPLINLSKDLLADKNSKIEVVAYASGTEDQSSISKRISLARALAVRGFLIDLGIDNVRISVRAMGNNVTDGPSERADILVIPTT